MQHVNPKWTQAGLVLVCERCCAERIPEEDLEIAERIGDFHLRNWLKERLKEDGYWGAVRAVNTSCLGVCARGKVTIALDVRSGEAPEVLVADPIEEKEALYERILDRIKKSG
jgi:hypothetical protein